MAHFINTVSFKSKKMGQEFVYTRHQISVLNLDRKITEGLQSLTDNFFGKTLSISRIFNRKQSCLALYTDSDSFLICMLENESSLGWFERSFALHEFVETHFELITFSC